MRSIRLRPDGQGISRLDSLSLPTAVPGARATSDDRAAAPPADLATQVTQLRTRSPDDGVLALPDGRVVVIVVSGRLTATTPGARASLGPGDVILIDRPAGTDHTIAAAGRARILALSVTDGWEPSGLVPAAVDEPARAEPLLERIYVADERANYRSFTDLFDAGDRDQPVLAASFIRLPPGITGDWHTEKPRNLVVVLSGAVEFEVGGAGGAQEFRPGDVCLVENSHGQGHVTRTRSQALFAAITLPDGHQWS